MAALGTAPHPDLATGQPRRQGGRLLRPPAVQPASRTRGPASCRASSASRWRWANPTSAACCKPPRGRQAIAEGYYEGIAQFLAEQRCTAPATRWRDRRRTRWSRGRRAVVPVTVTNGTNRTWPAGIGGRDAQRGAGRAVLRRLERRRAAARLGPDPGRPGAGGVGHPRAAVRRAAVPGLRRHGRPRPAQGGPGVRHAALGERRRPAAPAAAPGHGHRHAAATPTPSRRPRHRRPHPDPDRTPAPDEPTADADRTEPTPTADRRSRPRRRPTPTCRPQPSSQRRRPRRRTLLQLRPSPGIGPRPERRARRRRDEHDTSATELGPTSQR